jgi:FSR family fosmidomycin resistance protein-like MFS transporter
MSAQPSPHPTPRKASLGLAQGFAAIGHFYIHFFTSIYFVIVLALEKEWGQSYGELIGLWTAGSLLVGVGALPAGWLGDRWSARGMMAVFFVGIGAAAMLCGFTNGPVSLAIGLAGIGLFASIYHPVGIAWLVRNARQQGKALGFNGIFGNIGVSIAGILTGALIDFSGWRVAFILPGALSILTGIAMLWAIRAGRLIEGNQPGHKGRPPTKGEMVRGVAILLMAMFLSGIIYQATQAALPKQFELRFVDWLHGSTLGVGAMIAIVYGVAGLIQYFGGHVADRYNLKYVYAGAFLLQVPLLAAVSAVMGVPLLIATTLAVVLSVGLLPAENMMLTRFTPERHRALAFGVKYVISFGTAPLGLLLVRFVVEGTNGLDRLWLILAGAAAIVFIAALALPSDVRAAREATAPAE